MAEIIRFEEDQKIVTTMKYYGQSMFRIDKKMLESVAGNLRNGDQMVIIIQGFNKIRDNNGGKDVE